MLTVFRKRNNFGVSRIKPATDTKVQLFSFLLMASNRRSRMGTKADRNGQPRRTNSLGFGRIPS